MSHRDAAQVMAAECLCLRTRRVSRAITRVYDEALRPLGVEATQLTLLNAVTVADAGVGALLPRRTMVPATDPQRPCRAPYGRWRTESW